MPRLETIASIGAKSLITENKAIPDNSLVVGSPGKVVRQLTEEEAKAIKENAVRYQENWKKIFKIVYKIKMKKVFRDCGSGFVN